MQRELVVTPHIWLDKIIIYTFMEKPQMLANVNYYINYGMDVYLSKCIL